MPDEPITSADLKLVRDQIDMLQVAAAEKKKPWYRQRPSLVSLLAFVASIVTFFISHEGTTRQEIRSKQEALRKLLTDIVALQVEGDEQLARIQDDWRRRQFMSQMNDKRVIWIEAAESLVEQLGPNVSPSEFRSLAIQEYLNSEFDKAEKHYLAALRAAKDRFARVVALRGLAEFYAAQGPMHKPEKSTNYYQEAIATLGTPEDDYTRYMVGYTYESWAAADQTNKMPAQRSEHVTKARQHYSDMSPANPLRAEGLASLTRNNPDLP